MKYFAYGSNMSLARLRERAPGAQRLGSYALRGHVLCFHKVGTDGSGKCDAFFTKDANDLVLGALFELDASEKIHLDQVEGLGLGYEQKEVLLEDEIGRQVKASIYYATDIDASLKPYSWYKKHVLLGAMESALPNIYIENIRVIESVQDPDGKRDKQQRAIHDSFSKGPCSK